MISGYLSGILAQLAINIVIAYSVFLPAAAGLLNLGAAGFVLIGGYVAGGLTLKLGVPLLGPSMPHDVKNHWASWEA